MTRVFLSTPSARRATSESGRTGAYPNGFLSTPSARRATSVGSERQCVDCISIHALREEGDPQVGVSRSRFQNFYQRPPRGGRRKMDKSLKELHKFLSTPSARRATSAALGKQPRWHDFYPRPPRGGRRSTPSSVSKAETFLSTPSARRATQIIIIILTIIIFLSTPSARRATAASMSIFHNKNISIHALREEGDPAGLHRRLLLHISIHALREEGDSKNRDKISIFKQIIQHSARI